MEELGAALMLLFHVNQQLSQGSSSYHETERPQQMFTLDLHTRPTPDVLWTETWRILKIATTRLKSGSEVVTPRDI